MGEIIGSKQAAEKKPISLLGLIGIMGIVAVLSLLVGVPTCSFSALLCGAIGAFVWMKYEKPPEQLINKKSALAGAITGGFAGIIAGLVMVLDIGTKESIVWRVMMTFFVLICFALLSALTGLLGGYIYKSRTFTKPGKVQTQPIQDPPLREDYETKRIKLMLMAHLERLYSLLQSNPDVAGLQQLIKDLSTGEPWSFTVSFIGQQMLLALSGREISSETKLTTEWFIAVTVCPWLAPDEVRPHLPGGYLTLLNNLTDPAFTIPKGRHVAHWIYCSDGKEIGVHLTLISNPKVGRVMTIMAKDLMSESEMQTAGLS
jgi:hypothetical protein